MKKQVLLSGVAIAALISATAEAGTLFLAQMNGANEVPANTSTATGIGVLILNDARTSATVTGTHNLASVGANVIAGHIHRGIAGVNGPVIFPFPTPASPIGPLTWAIPAADVTNLENAGLYFNIHTTARPGGEIRAQLIRAVLAPSATTTAQRNLAAALDVSAGFSADLDQALIQANLLSSAAAKAQALDEISARSVYVQGRASNEAMASLSGSLLARAEDNRGADGSGAFGAIGYDFGKRSTTADGTGSKIERPFIMAGYEGAYDGGRAGLALGYAAGEEKLRQSLGKTEVDTIAVQGFFTAALAEDFYVDGTLGYGWSDIDTSRALPTLARTATSSHDGNVWSAALKLSKEFEMGNDGVAAPYGAIEYQKSDIDGYTEGGAGALGLVVPSLDTKEAAIEAGASFSMPSKQSWGTLAPRILLGWRHVIDETNGTFNATVVGSSVAFATPIAHPGAGSARIEASLVGSMNDGPTISFGYRGRVAGSGQDIHALELRARFKM
ncbi:MAG: autotransporter domain-containing protein [Rhodospirillaceae bacterium]|nr:autotransporter domain-containing protein [Rhodospirillaceae bacterium]